MSENFSRNIRLSSKPSLFSPYPANKINFTRFSWLDLVPKSIFFQFLSPAPVFFLSILVIEILTIEKNEYSGSLLLPFLILICINLLKNVIILRSELREEKKINEALVDVWNGKNFALAKSESLVVGSFVKVYEGQKSPADLLVVFSSSLDGTFYSDLGEFTARSELERKMSVFETQQIFKVGVEEAIREKMTGKIYFTDPSPSFGEFSGKMNFMKNPKYIDLRYRNLLLMSSRLSGVSFIIGIIIYAGVETKACSSIQKQSKKRNFLQVKLKHFLFFYIILYLFFAFSITLVSVEYSSRWENECFLHTFLEVSVLFSTMISVSMFIIYEFFLMIFAVKVQNCRIENLDVLENLKSLEYIVTSSTGVITENCYEVTLCIVFSKLYRKSVNFLTVSELDPANEDFSLFHDIDQDFTDLRDDLANEKSQEFFKCLLFCNLKLDSKEPGKGVRDELAINSFGKDIGAYVYSINTHSVILNISDQLMAFNIILSNKGKNSRIIIENNEESWTLYVRGTEKKLLNKLEINPKTKDLIFPKIERFKIKGLAFLILGKKNLSPKEIAWIKAEINNAESFPEQKEKRLEKVFQKLEKTSKFVGICGIEDSVRPETAQAIHSIKKTGTKLWVASSNKKTATLSACLKSGIIEDGHSILFMRRVESYGLCLRVLADAILKNIYLEESSGDLDDLNVFENKFSHPGEVFSEFNSTVKVSKSVNSFNLIYEDQFNSNIRALEERVMKKIEEPVSVLKDEFNVFIDRASFRTALSNPNTVKLLICLLFSAKSVCFYKLINKDKQDIIHMIKENFSFKPFVGAVGNRLEDIPMMQSADIGFYLKKSASDKLSYHDIKLSSFHDLKELIQSAGPSIYQKFSMFFLLFLYKNLLTAMVIFAYMTKCEYSLNTFYTRCFKICLNSWVTLPLSAVILDQVPDDKEIKNQYFFWFSDLNITSICILFLNSVIDSLVIYGSLMTKEGFIVNSSGKTEDAGFVFFMIFLMIVLTFWVEVMKNVAIFTSFVISSFMVSCAALVFFAVLYEISDLSDYHGIYQHLVTSPFALIQLVMVPLGTLVLKTLAHVIIYSLIKLKNCIFTQAKQRKLTTIYKHNLKSIKIVKDLYEIHKFSLKFMISHIENVYQLNFIQSNAKVMRIIISIITILNCIWIVIDPIIHFRSLDLLIINAVFSILMILLTLSTFASFFKTFYVKIILFFIFIRIFFKFIIELTSKEVSLLMTGITPSITYIFFNVDFLKVSVLNALGILEYLIVEFICNPEVYLNLKISEILTKIIIINISSAFLARAIETTYRQEYKLIKIQEQNYEKTQRILSVMLPEFVRKRVKDGVRYIAEDQGTVSIIFCDIDNFDLICAEYSPSELISFLDSFFQKLDSLCKIHGVSKIETVGKTYMACSGLKDSESEMDGSVKLIHHTKRSISFSLAVVEEAERFLMKNQRKLEVKVGINSGPVTAGVVGYHKPQFSLVGDTVNTASRMCTTLKSKNSIQISSNTFHMIPDVMNLKFTASTVIAKGKGEMNTFLIIPGFNEPTGTFDDAVSYKTASAITGTALQFETKLVCESLSLLEMNFRTATLFYKNSECCNVQLKESEKDKKIRVNKMESNKKILTPIFFTCSVNYLVEIARSVYGMNFGENIDRLAFYMRCCCFCLIVGLILVFKKVYLKRFYSSMILFLVFFLLSTTSIEVIRMKEKVGNESLEILDHMFIYLILIYCSGFSSRSLILLFPVMIFPNLYIQSSRSVTYTQVFDLILLTIFYFVNTSAIFNRETQIVNYFQLKTATEKDLAKTEDLLKQMMPAHVVENMKNHKTLTEKVPNVTLLYSDIVGFTEWSSKKSPNEIVNVLSEIFSRFDRLCLSHNVYKVHTIGDCYVVLGNLDFGKRNPGLECLNVVHMALAMIEVMKEVNVELAVQLNIRIGIHTGSIIAGIVGTDIVRYDIYGPDVLIANQMESNSLAGAINVSDKTRELLLDLDPACFTFQFNKELNFGTINKRIRTFLLTKN